MNDRRRNSKLLPITDTKEDNLAGNKQNSEIQPIPGSKRFYHTYTSNTNLWIGSIQAESKTGYKEA